MPELSRMLTEFCFALKYAASQLGLLLLFNQISVCITGSNAVYTKKQQTKMLDACQTGLRFFFYLVWSGNPKNTAD